MVKKVFAALFALAFTASAWAQNTSLELVPSSPTVGPNEQFTVAVNVINNTPDGVFGWSYAVAHNPAAVQIDLAEQGDLSGALPMGFPAAFQEVTIISNASGDGFINATILSLTEGFFYPGNGTNLIGTATYTNLQGADGDTSDIGLVDGVLANLPSPAVAIGVSRVMGQVDEIGSGLDVATAGTITIETEVPPPFQYTAGSNSVTAVLGSDPLEVTIPLSIQQINPLMGSSMTEIAGFSMGAEHDAAQLESLSVDPVAGATDAASVAFFGATVIDGGFVLGVIAETDPMSPFPALVPGADSTVATATYGPPVGAMPIGGEVYSSDVTFVDGLTSTGGTPGSAPVFNEVAVGDGMNPELFGAELVNGSATLMPVSTIDFIRGDCNDDGQINIADPITMIQAIIAGSGASDCIAACDADGSGSTNISDAILTIAFALGLDPADLSMSAPGTAMLAAPGAACGQFAGQTPEDCSAFNGCP